MTYCDGSECSKRDRCALHNPGEGTHEFIDWSRYGSCSYWTDQEGNHHSNMEHSCGDLGNFKCFEPMTPLTKEEALIEDINNLFRESLSKVLKPADIQIVELLIKQEGTLLYELWSSVIETIYKHNVK